MLAPQLVTKPETDPVSLGELKQHLRIDSNDLTDNAMISALGKSAAKHLDGWTGILGGLCLVEQTWKHFYKMFPCGASYDCNDLMQNVLRFKLAPVKEIVSVKYYDTAGVLQTLSAGAYSLLPTDALGESLSSIPGATTPWPTSVYASARPDAVIVEAKFGFGSAADVPETLRQAMRMHVAHLYENREAAGVPNLTEVPLGYADMIAPYRRSFFA